MKSLKAYASLELDGQKWVRETPLHRAAPELLAAFEKQLELIDAWSNDPAAPAVSFILELGLIAAAAIAKAEGRGP